MSGRDGGPAFPSTTDYTPKLRAGMTLRDYFAGQALAGLIANKRHISLDTGPDGDAVWCYAVADHMLAERSR